MVVNQNLLDDVLEGTIDYLSFLSDKYLNMILVGDIQTRKTEDKLMYLINLKNSLQNYGYATAYFTDDELRHIIEEITIVSDELPNNSLYGRS